MAEKEEFWSLLRSSRGDAVVLLSTFLLTIFVDLVTGIAVGVVLGALLFLHRMAEASKLTVGAPLTTLQMVPTESAMIPRWQPTVMSSFIASAVHFSSGQPRAY
jgi:SulP family sulfate permease